MKKILISILLLASLIGTGFAIWHINEAQSIKDEQTIYPVIGFENEAK